MRHERLFESQNLGQSEALDTEVQFHKSRGSFTTILPQMGSFRAGPPTLFREGPMFITSTRGSSHPPEGVKAMRHERLFECLDLGQSEFKIFLYWALWTSLCQFPIRTGWL